MRHFRPWVLIVPAMLIAAPAIAQEEREAEAPAEEQAPHEVGEEVPAEGAEAAPAEEISAEEADSLPVGEAVATEEAEATPDEAEEPQVEGEAEATGVDEEPLPTHDWEYALTPTSNAPNSSGLVKVTAVADTNSFVVELAGLPPVDSLDQDGRDVNAYTIWVVPDRERVLESTLAGAVTIDADGTGALASATTLPTFGVIVTATPDGAPATISGIPVLTGIPVEPEAPEEGMDAPEEGTETPEEGAEAPEGEASAENEAGPEPEPVDEPATEQGDPGADETEP